MLQTCQYVDLSLAHALVQGRGACSPLRCGLSNNKPLQKQYLHRKDSLVPTPGKAAEAKHSSQAAPAPPMSPAMPGCAGEVARPDSGQPCHRSGQRTHIHRVPSNSHHRPPARYGPLVPCFGHAEETDTCTQRARGTLTFTLNICCYSQSASIMKKRKKVN